MKRLLVVLDGVGDLPCPSLGSKTPLEAARKPNLDFLASHGKTGCINIAGKIAPESDVGVFSVLGFNPFKNHVGRGALEALGAGLKFENGWLALRANFATSDASGRRLLDRRVGRNLTTGEAKLLEKELNSKVKSAGGVRFVFKATVAHRGVVVFKKRGFSKVISNTDPAYVMKGRLASAQSEFEMRVEECEPLDKTRRARKAALLVNEFTRKVHFVLEKSAVNAKRRRQGKKPANSLLLRDAETRLRKPPNIYGKTRWALLADMPLEVGIAKLVGMHSVKLPAPTFGAGDYAIRARKTVGALKKFDAVYVHLKGPDLHGHDGDALGKKKSIEEIDLHYFGPLLKKIDLSKVRVVVTADHSTPCSLKAHSADSVPFLVTTGGFTCGHFEEWFCREAKPLPAQELMRRLLA